jgi:hypothetical protein
VFVAAAVVGIEDVEESRTSLDADGVEFVWLLPAADAVSNGSAVSCDEPDMELEVELELECALEGWRSEDDIMTMTSLLAQGLLDGEEKSSTFELYSRIRALLGKPSPRDEQATIPGWAGRGEGRIPVWSA